MELVTYVYVLYMCVSRVLTFPLQNALPFHDGNLKNNLSLRKRSVNYSCRSGPDSVKTSPGVDLPYTVRI